MIPHGNSVTSIGDNAFANCSNLRDFYLYAKQPPTADGLTFYDTNTTNVTLHVPANLLAVYKDTYPWRFFRAIVALTDDDPKPTGVEMVHGPVDKVTGYYDLSGRRLKEEPIQKGVYIHNGKKIMVK